MNTNIQIKASGFVAWLPKHSATVERDVKSDRYGSSTWTAGPSVEEVKKKYALTYREAAVLLGVSERTVWGLVKHGEIPHLKLGKAVRILRSELEAWAMARSASTRAGLEVHPAHEGGDDDLKGAA